MLISAQDLYKQYGTRTLLDGVSFTVEEGNRFGVVGLNGAGKSTLLKILAGVEEQDGGKVIRQPNLRLGYLPQNPVVDENHTILEHVFATYPEEARELAEYEAKTILTKLGITKFDEKMGNLSGGERRRTALATVLAGQCDFLILDEPTNHLDATMTLWLEEHLRRFSGALMMVTHDRYFLERVTNHTLEVEGGNLYTYDGGYSKYLEGKATREEMERGSARKRASILRREQQWVLQGPTARGTKSRERLDRFETLKNQEGFQEKSSLDLSSLTSRMGKKTVELTGVSKAFDGRTIIENLDLLLLRQDRVGIVGVNGSGKSTLLNLLTGNLAPDSGTVDIGDTIRMGYFSQITPPMDGSMRVIDYVKEIGNTIETPEGTLTASQLLEKFLFPADVQWAPVSKLSGGEGRRLFLLSILAAAPNFLILDEPTNDLDLETLTILEDYLETFPGIVVAVSHDRYFLDKMANRLLVVEGDGRVTPHVGEYSLYLEGLQRQSAPPKEVKKDKPAQKSTGGNQKFKFTFKEQRDFEFIEDDIAKLEEQLATLQQEMTAKASDYMALQALQQQEEQLNQALEEKMERWEYLTDLAEKIANQSAT